MKLDIAIDLCRAFEGFKPRPYLCPAGIPTIGYGTIRYPNGVRVALTDDPISEPVAQNLLLWEFTKVCVPGVVRLCPGLASSEKRFNAIVDFCYNLGVGRLQTSTLRRKINAREWDEAKTELGKWVRGGGKILPGLVKRRQAECLLMGD